MFREILMETGLTLMHRWHSPVLVCKVATFSAALSAAVYRKRQSGVVVGRALSSPCRQLDSYADRNSDASTMPTIHRCSRGCDR